MHRCQADSRAPKPERCRSWSAGGGLDVLERCRPVLEAMGKTISHIGASGAGQVCKVCNQVAVAINIHAVAESLTLARKSGVDPAKVRDALLGGFARSTAMDLH